MFWRGAYTNEDRKILSKSRLVQKSGKADVQLLDWDKGLEDPDFKRKFVSLDGHCDFRYETLPSINWEQHSKYASLMQQYLSQHLDN